jgi:hypothetical protein
MYNQENNSAILFSRKSWYEYSVFIIKFEVLDAFCSLFFHQKVSQYVSYRDYGIMICIGSAKGCIVPALLDKWLFLFLLLM